MKQTNNDKSYHDDHSIHIENSRIKESIVGGLGLSRNEERNKKESKVIWKIVIPIIVAVVGTIIAAVICNYMDLN